jgi:hypothetical protein
MNVINDTRRDNKQINAWEPLLQCLLLEVLHQLWVQTNAQLAPECLLSRLTRHYRV